MSTPSPTRCISFRRIVLLLTACLLPGLVNASASFSGLGISALMLTGVDGVKSLPAGASVQYQALVADSPTEALGRGATAEVDAALAPTELGDMPFYDPEHPEQTQLRQGQTASGWAGDGLARARILTGGLIFLANDSGGDVTFNFGYALFASLLASTDPFGIGAEADVTWVVEALVGLNIETVVSLALHVAAGDPRQELSAADAFDITLGAGTQVTLTSYLDTWGYAEAPEPPVWALLAVGLAVTTARRRTLSGRRRGV